MSWSEIKKAVNSDLSKPLNELIDEKSVDKASMVSNLKILTANGIHGGSTVFSITGKGRLCALSIIPMMTTYTSATYTYTKFTFTVNKDGKVFRTGTFTPNIGDSSGRPHGLNIMSKKIFDAEIDICIPYGYINMPPLYYNASPKVVLYKIFDPTSSNLSHTFTNNNNKDVSRDPNCIFSQRLWQFPSDDELEFNSSLSLIISGTSSNSTYPGNFFGALVYELDE